MGGAPGPGAAPVVAELAANRRGSPLRSSTKPFASKAASAWRPPSGGIADSNRKVNAHHDPHERILQIIEKRTPLNEAFAYADDVLRQGIQGIRRT